MKKLITLTLSLFLTLSVHASPARQGVRLLDLLIRESGISEVLTRQGLAAGSASSVQTYVRNSLDSLGLGNGTIRAQDLRRLLEQLPASGDDLVTQRQLISVLERNIDDLSYDEVVAAVNNLIYLANRHGIRGSQILACAECANTALRQAGFRFTFEQIQDANTTRLLEQVLPRNPRDLQNYIARQMNSKNLGNFRNITRDVLSPEEERTFALFLSMIDHGTPSQKALSQAILDISREPQTGTVRLLNADNPHALWRLATYDMSDDSMQYWTRIISEAAEEGRDQVSKENAFFRVLEYRHHGDEKSLEMIANLRRNNCLFK
jgi:hypothetical protein